MTLIRIRSGFQYKINMDCSSREKNVVYLLERQPILKSSLALTTGEYLLLLEENGFFLE